MPARPSPDRMGVGSSATRLEIVGAQLIGLAMIRFLLKVEPIASLSVEELVPLVAPSPRQVLGTGAPAPACSCRQELTVVPW